MSVPAILRAGASALIPETVVTKIFDGTRQKSFVMDSFLHVPVPRTISKMPVVSGLPYASWRGGDTGLSGVSDVSWANKYIYVDDLDVIVPVPKTVIGDTEFDLWAAALPLIQDALARKLDISFFLPNSGKVLSTWPTDVFTAASAASNTVTWGTATQAQGGVAQDINALLAKVEGHGFAPTNLCFQPSFKQYLRGARDTTGQKLFDVALNTVEGLPVSFSMGGAFGTSSGSPVGFAIDGSKFALGIRRDVTIQISDQAVLTDEDGNIMYNLWQQEMVALKVSFRMGWQVSNEVTYEGLSSGTNEVQTFTISGSPTGGSYTLTFNGVTTKAIAYNATASDFQDRLQAIKSIGRDNVSVARSGSSPNFVYTVTFKNRLGSQNVSQITLETNGLTGGTTPTVTPATSTPGVAASPYAGAVLLKS